MSRLIPEYIRYVMLDELNKDVLYDALTKKIFQLALRYLQNYWKTNRQNVVRGERKSDELINFRECSQLSFFPSRL